MRFARNDGLKAEKVIRRSKIELVRIDLSGRSALDYPMKSPPPMLETWGEVGERVHPAERPATIRRVAQAMTNGWILDSSLDPQGTPADFADVAIASNPMIENHLDSYHLPSLLNADSPEELASRMLPALGGLD